MSYTIKPEDVSQSILELAMERFEKAYWNQVTPQNVADFLQDCIEAGVVSPPVWAIRNIKTGALVERRGVPVLVLDGNPTDSDLWTKEHWKGQTE